MDRHIKRGKLNNNRTGTEFVEAIKGFAGSVGSSKRLGTGDVRISEEDLELCNSDNDEISVDEKRVLETAEATYNVQVGSIVYIQ